MITKPLKFETVEILQEKVREYFDTTPKDEWTITGLALALDTSRKVLCDYEDNRPEYSNAIKRAKLIVENGYEIDLKKHGRTGTIFALKNFDWKDKNETDITTGGKPLPLFDRTNESQNNSTSENTSPNQENTSN